MSEKFSSAMPHSKPFSTSLTSSLKRCSDAMRPFVHDDVVADQAHLVAPLDLAFDAPCSRRPCPTLVTLKTCFTWALPMIVSLMLRLKQAFHGGLHVGDDLVDDAVDPDADAFMIGEPFDGRCRAGY